MHKHTSVNRCRIGGGIDECTNVHAPVSPLHLARLIDVVLRLYLQGRTVIIFIPSTGIFAMDKIAGEIVKWTT